MTCFGDGKNCAAITLLVCGERVWVARRVPDAQWGAGLLECPGGKIDDGELAEVAAQREVAEEAGLKLERERYQYRGVAKVNGWWLWLYIAELGRTEWPRDTEPMKRGRWYPVAPDGLKMRSCTPGLGALLSIFTEELRAAQEGDRRCRAARLRR